MAVDTFQICYSMTTGQQMYDVSMKIKHEDDKYLQFQTIVDKRLRVLEFLYKHGLKLTLDAFPEVKTSTLYDWKKIYEASGKRRESLIPKSTRPKNFRHRIVDWRLIDAIARLRNKDIVQSPYARFLNIPPEVMKEIPYDIGEKQVKTFLDPIALGLGLPCISASTIGRIIKDKCLYFAPHKQKGHPQGKRPDITRIKNAPRLGKPGYIQADCITHHVANRTVKCIDFIDIFSKVSYSKRVSSLNSHETMIAFTEFCDICNYYYGFDVFALQHDNGAEFFGELLEYLSLPKDNPDYTGIKNYFILPRCPKIDGTIERFNRTLQEEFINQTDALYQENWQLNFDESLVNYLLYFNNYRAHQSLNLMSPKNYIKNFYSEM